MAANPLIRQLGLQDLLKRDAQPVPEFKTFSDQATETALAGYISKVWERNKLAKNLIERRMLANLRARRGEYSEQQLAIIQQNGGQNIVWADVTETKCRAGSAWIREVLAPTGQRAWGIKPTPIPELPMAMKKAIVNKAIQQAMALLKQSAEAGDVMSQEDFRQTVANVGEKLRQQAETEMRKVADRRARRMEDVIADRLAQGGWDQAIDEFVEDFVTYPAAIIKGPVYRRVRQLSWGNGWKPMVSDNPAQTWARVSPFDIYPSVGATDCQKGDLVERVRFWRSELHAMKGLPGYQDEEIDKALKEYVGGHLEGWLWTDAERQRLEKETMYQFLSPTGVIDALNFWGSVPGWMLMSWGVREDLEPTREYEVEVLKVGRYIVYCALNPHPLGRRPYRKAAYDEIPGAFWGRCPPDLVATHQQMCNAIACSLADNLGVSSGPMGWVHMDRLADGEQSMTWAPWKLFQLKSDPSQGVNPGIGVFATPDNSTALMNTYSQWEQRADDASGIPRYTYGNGQQVGAGDTAAGLSMLMNNAAKGLRRAIGNVDLRVIAPTIYDAFLNEMLYNEDTSIKGDCIVVPRGAAAILIKESAQARRTQFLGMTANEFDMQIIGTKGRAALLREVADIMELPEETVPTDEEIEEREKKAAEAQQAQLEQQLAMQKEQQQQQVQLEAQRSQANEQGKLQAQTLQIIGDIVKQAVGAEMQRNRPKGMKYRSGEDGTIEGADLEY